MEQSKTLQNVMIRAKGEALRMNGAAPVEEHIYLSLLKVSLLSSEKIAPSSAERASIDAEIRQINEILERAGVDPVSAGEALRAEMANQPAVSAAAAEARVQKLFDRSASFAGEKLTAPAVLTALLQSPTDLIMQANGGGALPKPPKREEQGRAEFWAAGNSSVHGPGSQSTPGGTDKNTGAAKFVMPDMPDPNEFNDSAVTVFDLPDEPKPPIQPRISLEVPPEEPTADSIVDVDDDDTPEEPPKPQEPKKSGAKSDGVDLVAIMRELREKRIRGDDAPASGEDEDVKPVLKPQPRPDPKPEPKPEQKPEPPKTDVPKPREGVDLAAIMKELRERRIREQKEKSDKPDDDGGDAEPDRGSVPLAAPKQPRVQPALPPVRAGTTASGVAKKKKTTVFLGRTYHTGLLGAVMIYLLICGLIQVGFITVIEGAGVLIGIDPNTSTFIGVLIVADVLFALYCLLRVASGLIGQKHKPFALYLDYLLFVGLIGGIAASLTITYDTMPAWFFVVIKIACGAAAIVKGVRMHERISKLPNTRGIARKDLFLGVSLSGSPDKIAFQKLLSLGYVPILLLTVYWILKRTVDTAAAIVLFWFAYAALYALAGSTPLWYDKDDPRRTKRDERRNAAASVFRVEVIVLMAPAFVLFLTVLYHWRPVPGWTIFIYCIFALIATFAAVAAGRPNHSK